MKEYVTPSIDMLLFAEQGIGCDIASLSNSNDNDGTDIDWE
jgi:hypothetical protein